MENNTKQCGGCVNGTCQGGCMNKGNGCGGCCGAKNHTMHMILKVLLLALVFMCGFKLGMITGYIGHGYERGGMMHGGYGQKFDGQGAGMMRGYKNVQPPVPAVIETTIKK